MIKVKISKTPKEAVAYFKNDLKCLTGQWTSPKEKHRAESDRIQNC